MNKLVSRNPVLRFKIQYYLGGTPKGGINLGIKSKKEIESNNNRERNLASHHFSKVFSDNEGIWDGIKHLARGILHGYNGYLDPETLYLTGAPTILPGRTPTKVPSVKKVGNMLKNKLFLRGYNRSGVKISAIPRSQVPDGETITFFKNANGTRTPKYYDKKYGHWIEVMDDVDNDVKVVGYASNASAKPTIKPITNYNNDTLIVSNIEPYDYNNDIMMVNSAFDDAYNYDPGLLDLFKKGGILPSRNPVLRFKLGRKIVKAKTGLSGKELKEFIESGKGVGVVDGKKINTSSPKKFNSSYTRNTEYNDQYGLAGDVQRNWRGTKGVIADNDLKLLLEMGFKIQDLKNAAREAQLFIRDNGLGQYNVALDNAWGGLSSDALKSVYQMWKAKKEADEAAASLKPVVEKPSSTILLPEVPTTPRPAMSNYIYYAKNLKQALGRNNNFSGLSNLVWKEYADDDDSFAANFSRDMRTRFGDYKDQLSWLNNQAAIEKALNISGKYRSTRAGDYSDIANSMAKWAGEYNYNNVNKPLNYYNAIIDKYKRTIGGYKMGGLLPSRNVIERFKLGRKIIFAQGGTYFPVTVGGRTYQYNPYNGSYKGTQGSGLNVSYKDIEGAFNKQYEGVSHSGNKVYRRKGSHTTWTNSAGKQVNLAPTKKAQSNTSFKTSANGRFRVVDQTSGKELRFDSRDEAKKYQTSATKLGTRVLYDDKKEGYGVLKVDRTKEKSTEWARNQRETNNNKSRAEAYKAARERGDRWFAYDGKVYSSDLKNYKNDNLTEMKAIYGNDLGWGKDPNYNTKSSAQARNTQNKEIKALNSNRNANYQGKTNKQASAEADKKVAQTWNEEDFVDALLPATAVGNGINYLASTAMGEDYHPEVFHSGLNPAVGMANLMRGEWNKVGERALNAASIFGGPWIGRGVKWLGTRMAPEIANLGSKSAYLSQRATVPVANGTGRTLNGMAERAISGNFTSPTTTYGRYSLQKAADKGLLDQFATNGGFNNAVRWGDKLVRNNNTGTGYIFRSGTTHPYDAAVDAGTKVIPWVTSLGTPVVSTTLHNMTEE